MLANAPEENPAGQHDVGPAADEIDEPAAQVPEQEIEEEGDPGADGERDARLHRVVGKNAVIHVHGEQRIGQREQVDDDRG
jgi:hypothetical protein